MAMTEFKHGETILGTTYDFDAVTDNFDASTIIWSTQNLRTFKDDRVTIVTWTEV